jgi:penicillin-binding protein 1A
MAMNRSGSSAASRPSTPRGPRKRTNWLVVFAWLVALGALAMGGLIGVALVYFDGQLPDFRQLTNYKPPLITRVYDRNGEILAEYADERRIWVPINEIPKPVIQAFLAAEDSHFYEHGGYDLKAILRATLVNAFTHRTQGASTITQQVAKTYLLSSERTYTRKIKELILSWRIEKAFSKNEILELYLNRIYLGNGSYGIAAAAQTYFSKSLNELTIPERALIAGMPQAPTRYNPVKNPGVAKARRDIVIRRLEEENYITKEEADAAIATPLNLKVSALKQGEDAPHFAEYIRQMIEKQYGDEALYKGGYSIFTTLDLPTQRKAETAVYEGLKNFDRRHGWRGAFKHLKDMEDWQGQVEDIADEYAHSWRIGEPAVVLKTGRDTARIGLAGGIEGIVPSSSAKWTGKSSMDALVKVGDVIMVKPIDTKGKVDAVPKFSLEQLPAVQGAMVVLDVRTGEVLAMVGGLGEGVGFNRAIMAKRQVGSSFKPFVYTAAMEKGYTPATTILDAPIVFRTGDNEWKPHNYDNKFNGWTTLRKGLEQSRNLMTVRLAQDIGLRQVADVVKRLGVSTPVPVTDLSVALGSLNVTLMDMVSAYSVFPRGGTYIPPTFLRRVQDSQGVTLYRAHPACEDCMAQLGASVNKLPSLPQTASQQALDPKVAYQMVSLMQGVVLRGTGYALSTLGRPLAGKTGTTNDFIDAWFVGYSPSIAAGVWVGYDTPKSLGHGETGGRAALPIWKDFAEAEFDGQPIEGFTVPDGIDFVQIDADTGLLPGSNSQHVMTESFIEGTAPSTTTPAYISDPSTFDGGSMGGGQGGSEGDGSNPIQNLLKSFGIF